MSRVEIFDPAMCCSTGVCGTDVDPTLSRFASDLAWLSARGVQVDRATLSQEPAAFIANDAVRQALGTDGTAAHGARRRCGEGEGALPQPDRAGGVGRRPATGTPPQCGRRGPVHEPAVLLRRIRKLLT